jgi:hypothetical protein
MATKPKPKPPPDDPEQSARFVEAAKALGADSTGAFSAAFKIVVPKKKRRRQRRAIP